MSAICDTHKKKMGIEQLYNSVHRKFNHLDIRCGRENQHPAEGALRNPYWAVEVQISWREEWGSCPRETWPPGPRLISPEEQERNVVMAGSICWSSVRSPTPSHSKTFSIPFEPFQIKWEVYFSKKLCRLSLLCRLYDSAYRRICIMWLNNICICQSESRYSCWYVKQ